MQALIVYATGCVGGHQLSPIESANCRNHLSHASSKTSLLDILILTLLTLNQTYEAQRWHQFLIYIGLTLGAFIINAFMNSLLPLIYRGACTNPKIPVRGSG